jgi:hypothetical protein
VFISHSLLLCLLSSLHLLHLHLTPPPPSPPPPPLPPPPLQGTLCEALLMVEAFKGNLVCPNKQNDPLESFHEVRTRTSNLLRGHYTYSYLLHLYLSPILSSNSSLLICFHHPHIHTLIFISTTVTITIMLIPILPLPFSPSFSPLYRVIYWKVRRT